MVGPRPGPRPRHRPGAGPHPRPQHGRGAGRRPIRAPAWPDRRRSATRCSPRASCTTGRYPDSINSLVTPGDVPARAPPAVLVPGHRRRDRQAHRRPRAGPRLADTGALRDGDGGAERPARRSPGRRPSRSTWATRRSARCTWAPACATASSRRRGWAWPCRCSPIRSPARRRRRRSPARSPSRTPRSSPAWCWRRPRLRATACGYGARLSVADPRDGRLLCGAGQWALASVGATLLARRHGLACDCYGPDTSAPLVDVQAGYQQALPALAGALARPCMMSGIGVWGDTTTCLELLVIGDAIYRLALDCARAAGLGRRRPRRGRDDRGRHRRERLPRHAPHPALAARQPRLGGPQLARRVRGVGRRRAAPTRWSWRSARVDEALAREPVGLPDDVEAELCRLIDEAAARLGLSGAPGPAPAAREARGAGPRPPARGARRVSSRRAPPRPRAAAPRSIRLAHAAGAAAGTAPRPARQAAATTANAAAAAERVERPAAEQRPERVPAHVHERPHAHVAATQLHRREPGDDGRRDGDEQDDAEADTR